ncbi:MAG: signal peptidase I [Clostridia bacterium]|nr:signal peptidase I [Clostridia bacterium]
MKIFNVLYNIVAIIIVLVFAFTVGLKVTDTKTFAVATPSMEDELHEGDMVFVRQAGEYAEGDIITARLPSGGTFTHRIDYIDYENNLVYTKGDSNPQLDPLPTALDDIIGKVVFSVPALGFISLNFNSTAVITVLAAVLIAIMLVRFVVYKFKQKGERS